MNLVFQKELNFSYENNSHLLQDSMIVRFIALLFYLLCFLLNLYLPNFISYFTTFINPFFYYFIQILFNFTINYFYFFILNLIHTLLLMFYFLKLYFKYIHHKYKNYRSVMFLKKVIEITTISHLIRLQSSQSATYEFR